MKHLVDINLKGITFEDEDLRNLAIAVSASKASVRFVLDDLELKASVVAQFLRYLNAERSPSVSSKAMEYFKRSQVPNNEAPISLDLRISSDSAQQEYENVLKSFKALDKLDCRFVCLNDDSMRIHCESKM